jgi:hypothetical protein
LIITPRPLLLFSISISSRSTPHSLCVSQHQQQRQDVFALYSRHVVRGVGRQEHLFRMGSVHDKSILQVRRPLLFDVDFPSLTRSFPRWPVIIGIVVGAVIAISIVWCLVRCLCCGLECCCSCLSCFSCCTSCCNNNHRRHQGYTQAPPPVSQFPQYTQYQPAAAPVYRSQQQQQNPQYAHFDAPSKPFNEDALPAMPSWNNSRTLRQQDNEVNEMEMGSMHNQAAQPMLPKSPRAQVQEYPYQANAGAYGGDLASSRAELPRQPQQYGYGRQSPRVAAQGYEGSIAAPPSYHTTAPGVARKPVSGSWRDL